MLQHYDQVKSTPVHMEQCVTHGEHSVAAADCLYPVPESSSSVGVYRRRSAAQSIIARRVHRDFVGLESADPPTRSAIVNFSYHLTVGNMDEAFHAIRVVKWSVTVADFMPDRDLNLGVELRLSSSLLTVTFKKHLKSLLFTSSF